MIPSLINIILCMLVLGLDLANYPLSSLAFKAIISVVLCFNLISFLMAISRKKLANEQLGILKDLLATFDIKSNSLSLNDHLKLICEEVKKTHQKTNSISNKSDFLCQTIYQSAADLKNINKVLNYLNANNYEEIKELIKNHNKTSIQTLADRAKLSFSYETHYDKEPIGVYEGYSAAILLSDDLENFIVSQILKQQGIYVQSFSAKANFSNFDVIIADDTSGLVANNVLLLSNQQHHQRCLKRPFDRLGFLRIVKDILSSIDASQRLKIAASPACNDALIFMQNSLANSQMLHELNKHASANMAVSSLSEFKRLLQEEFKIILLAAECVLYDYEAIKSLINSAKLSRPKLFVMVFCEQKSGKSYDFADCIIKNESQAKIIEIIKKHL